MPPTGKKKEKKAASTESASLGSTAPLGDVIAQASRLVETVAILRALRTDIATKFHSDTDRLPPCLLQRRGSGPRAAMTAAVVDAEVLLEGMARQLEDRVRALLVLPVDLGDNEAPGPADVPFVDEVVSTRDAEFEIARAKKTLRKEEAGERIVAERLKEEMESWGA